jgi:hypothetical protein
MENQQQDSEHDQHGIAAQQAAAKDYQPDYEGAAVVGGLTPSNVITQEYAKADPIYVEKTAVSNAPSSPMTCCLITCHLHPLSWFDLSSHSFVSNGPLRDGTAEAVFDWGMPCREIIRGAMEAQADV